MVRTVPGTGTVPTVHFVNKTFTLLESIKSLTAKSVIAVFLPKSIAYIYLDNVLVVMVVVGIAILLVIQ